ncbi:MAG TPA: endonuclease, partial [Elusimicrobiales bacterium]|nr:endonuclease [Elusimicrobiales bacterium]
MLYNNSGVERYSGGGSLTRFSAVATILLLIPALPAGAASPSPSEQLFSGSAEVGLPEARYYPSYSGLSGARLFDALHDATEIPRDMGGHDYLKAKKFMFSSADNTGCGGRPGVTAFYSQVCVRGDSEYGGDYGETGDANGDGYADNSMNAEHIWPQGYFNSAYPMKADLHHLAPTFLTPNGMRGSYPFGPAGDAVYSTSAGSILSSTGEFEPADAVKGNVARAMLYFVTRYHDRNIDDGMDYREFWTDRVAMFLEWSRRDPPDAAERRRNDLIETFQGNRNPYIDDPSLAERVG